jgi:purine-nucleoside phosphorylase
MREKQKLDEATDRLVIEMGGFMPTVSITLGSGLGYMVGLLEDAHSCAYSDIPHCRTPCATGHAGKLWWGKLHGIPVIMLQGRIHLYEGYTVHEVVFMTRLLIRYGVKRLILTHATGALTRNLEKGDIVGVWNQIAEGCPDPTSGPDANELGEEFVPIDPVFDPALLAVAKKCALEERVSFHRGVSHFKFGRTYESMAEGEKMARAGADVATMSTIPENVAAAHMGAKVLDLAVVTDMVANVRDDKNAVSHAEVLQAGEDNKESFGRLITAIVGEIAKIPTK